MTLRAWGATALAALLVVGGLWLYTQHQESRVAESAQESAMLKGQVDALKQEAQSHKAMADQAGQRVAEQDQVIAALKTKLARVKNPSNSPAPVVVRPEGQDGAPAETADQLKDQIIEAQDQQIGTLKIEVSELRQALDAQGRALTASEQRARGLEIALDAQRHAAASGKWLHRFQGFAVGIGVGYISGKVH